MTRRRQNSDVGRKSTFAAALCAFAMLVSGCDQAAQVWGRVSRAANDGAGPARLEDVPLDARALAGAVQQQDQIAALLAPAPVLAAAGQILVGLRVEPMLALAGEELGLPSPVVRALRSRGFDGLRQTPYASIPELLQRAEAKASEGVVDRVRDELARVGVSGSVALRPGGFVVVDVAPPTQAAMGAPPATLEWNDADRCPMFAFQGAMQQDVALAMRCTMQRLRASGLFAYVEPNYIAAPAFTSPPQRAPSPPQRGGMPNDPLLPLQWDFRERGTGEAQSPGGAGFVDFWRAGQTGSHAVRVAIVDSGIDATHPEFRGASIIGAGADLISDPARSSDGDGVDSNPQDAGDRCGDASENSFHGAQTAGLIGASAGNRQGVAGAAWAVTLQPVRVLGRCGGALADIVSGIRWAAGLAPAMVGNTSLINRMPADIIHLGFSLQGQCPASMQAAIDAAVARNAVVVVPAGNKADQAANYAPANCNNVVVTAATDARGELAFYSNFGSQVDVVAPGGDLFADSDNDLRPDGILVTRATQTGCYDPINRNSTPTCFYGYVQGTSVAAAHVSAAFALLAAQTGLRGRSLENAFFTRAVSPFPRDFARIDCARSRNAVPVGPAGTLCNRPSGRGYLDLARAARTIPQATTAP